MNDIIEQAARVLSTLTTCDGQPHVTELHRRQARALADAGLLAQSRPEPDWLDAPAILADCRYCDDAWHQVLHKPNINGSHWECTTCLTTTGYKSLENVVALYPEEDKGGMFITGPGNIQIKDRNGQTVWEI